MTKEKLQVRDLLIKDDFGNRHLLQKQCAPSISHVVSRQVEYDIYELSEDKRYSLRCHQQSYRLEIYDESNGKLVRQNKDTLGYHTGGKINGHRKEAIYFSFDRHWYLNPRIVLWDWKANSLAELFTKHNEQTRYFKFDYDFDSGLCITCGFGGEIGVHHLQQGETVWFGRIQDLCQKDVLNIAMSEDKLYFSVLTKGKLFLFSLPEVKLMQCLEINDCFKLSVFQSDE